MRTGKKKRIRPSKILCLMLSLLLLATTMPLNNTLASGVHAEEAETESEDLIIEESEPVDTSEPDEEPEDTTYANSISGVLWIDANEDGTYDGDEQPLADYPVYLYLEGDMDNAVQTATTDADGKYLFEDIEPGRNVVGVKAEENGTEYLLPLMGVQKDNKFYFAPDWSKVISNAIDIAADTVVEDIDAAMRTMPQIQPMAGPYVDEIDVGAATTAITISTSGTYRLYGTTTSNSRYITVASGVTATFDLDGVSMTCSTSPIRLNGTANVTLVLMDGKANTFRCTGTSNTSGAIQAGIYVQQNATLTIEGAGMLNATGGAYGAGIGGIYTSPSTPNGTVIINSGTVTATSTDAAGIGGGLYGAGGNIIINGGTVTAKSTGSSSQGSGIGGGPFGNGGTITITGGVIKATGGASVNSGTGIGAGSSAIVGTNIFTGGSIEARNGYSNAIETRIATTTTNGTSNGTQQVYCIAVKVVQGDGITPVAGAEVRIPNNDTSGYLYTATTDSTGIAFCWVPTATAKMIEAEHEDYGAGQTDPDPDILANNTNTTTIILGMRTTLSRTPNTIAFISDTNPTPVTLNVKAENMVLPAGLKEIVGLEWFRVSTTDTTVYNSGSFASGYSAATSGNSGTDADMSVDDPTSNDERNYEMPVSENGKYWVMVHYKDKNGVDRYQVKSIVIDNVYTPSTLTYKGVNVSDSSEIVFPSTDYIGAGVAYQLNSTTIIYSTADGTTAVAGTGAQITLNAPDQTPYWITPSPASYSVNVDGVALGEKVFTYAKDPAWWVTITYAAVMDTGGSVSIVSNTNPTSVKLNVARTNVEPNVNAAALNIELVGYRDSNSATPTAVIPITTAFTPSANTTITFVYRISGHTITINYEDTSGTAIPGNPSATAIAPDSTPYTVTAPAISGYECVGVIVDGGTRDAAKAVYYNASVTGPHTITFVYSSSSTLINVTIPTKIIWASFASSGTVTAPNYYMTNNSSLPVNVTLTNFTVTNADGVTLVASSPAGGQYTLNMIGSSGFSNITGLVGGSSGTLGQLGITSSDKTGGFTLTGQYAGSYSVQRKPAFDAVFRFSAVLPSTTP